jgi:hypothetical protein
MRTAVTLIIFNRPDVTARVFDEIARARPRQLLVIADGPRPERAGEAEKCAATRAVIDRVDWDCEVLRNYSEVNLGCGPRVSSGLSWVFEQVDKAIILEDDCLPDPTFFRFCDDLLEKYQDDERVMHISGDNWHFGQNHAPFSYFFSWYCYSCGWATWRRAFQYYDPQLKLWPALRGTTWLLDILGDPRAVAFWEKYFERAHTKGIYSSDVAWDWSWLFACWANRGLSILPAANLISNIGFGGDATHTKRTDDARANVPTVAMRFPLIHPACIVRDRDADNKIVQQVGLQPERDDLYYRLRRKCAAALPAPVRQAIASFRGA